MKAYGREDEGRGGLRAVLSAAGAGGMFAAFWLGLGVPLAYSVVAGLAGYGSLWLLLGSALGGRKTPSAGTYVDRELARRTSAEAASLARKLEAAIRSFPPRDPLLPRFRRLVELLDAIGRDVEADPKDAASAAAFLGGQGSAGERLATLCGALEGRGASRERTAEARARAAKTLDRLVSAFENHLARLQDDNLDELATELEILEENLGFEDEFERMARESGREPPK